MSAVLKRKHKFGAKRCEIDGISFDSLLEGRRYQALKLLQHAKVIEDLKIHPRFDLHAFVGKEREGVKVGQYEADASYWLQEEPGCRRWVVEDCKGFVTPLAKWKMRHFEAEYGVKINIVRKVKHERQITLRRAQRAIDVSARVR